MRDDARAIFDAGVEAVDPDCPIKTKKSLSIREAREVRDDRPPGTPFPAIRPLRKFSCITKARLYPIEN